MLGEPIVDGSIGTGWSGDQAAGLRRLFGGRSPQVMAFASARESAGRTALLTKVAMDLTRVGQRVLVIDEHDGLDNAIHSLGFSVRGDFLSVLQGDCALRQVMFQATPLLQLLPAKHAARELDRAHRSSEIARKSLAYYLQEIQREVDFILIDSIIRRGGQLSILSQAARHMTVVVDAHGQAITQAYALIKRTVQEKGRDGFHVAVAQAKNSNEAVAIFDNMRSVAREYLDVHLDYLGATFKSPQSAAHNDIAEALMQRIPAMYGTASGFSGSFALLNDELLDMRTSFSRSRFGLPAEQCGAVGLDSVV